MEQLFEDRSVRWLRGQLQPVDLAKRLARTMELNQSIYLDKVTAPNSYALFLNPVDFEGFEHYKTVLERDLAQYLTDHSRELGVGMSGQAAVSIQVDVSLRRRQMRVEVATTEAQVTTITSTDADQAETFVTSRIDRSLLRQQALPKAWLVLRNGTADERRFPIINLPCRLGRSPDNDIVVEDHRASRHHAQIIEEQGNLSLVDLGSTNGTLVNQKTGQKHILKNGAVISLGGVELVVDLVEGL